MSCSHQAIAAAWLSSSATSTDERPVGVSQSGSAATSWSQTFEMPGVLAVGERRRLSAART